MKKLLSIGLCLSLIGCVHFVNVQEKPFVNPQYGMTKDQMIALLGVPESVEIYKKSDLTRVEFYFYVRKYQSSRTKVPVCVVNKRVVGWGKSYYEDHVSQDDIRLK